MSHTPGPWKVVMTGAAQQANIAVVGNGKLIYEFPMRVIDEHPEHEANAQLIAAAPEMLEALEAVKRDRQLHLQSGSVIEVTCKTYGKIDKALAKAEGGSNPA